MRTSGPSSVVWKEPERKCVSVSTERCSSPIRKIDKNGADFAMTRALVVAVNFHFSKENDNYWILLVRMWLTCSWFLVFLLITVCLRDQPVFLNVLHICNVPFR